MSNLRVGSLVKGTVIYVDDTLAYVNVGGKSEGRIYLDHYTANKDIKSLKDVLHVDDVINVEVTSTKTKDGEECILLSRLGLEEKEKRDKIIKKIMNRKPFMAMVKSVVDDGLILSKDDVNLLLPNNYIDLDNKFDKASLVGTDVKVVFVRTEQTDKNRTVFVVSRKQIQYNEERKAREEEFASINVDDVKEGTVVRLTDFGAFVKFNSIEGLVHLSEISYYHIKSASEILAIGDKVQVKVIKKTDSKIQLSIKALDKTPWEKFLENHKVSDEVEAKIVKKSDNWMLCEVERDVVGILNKEDYSWNPDDNFAGTVEEGDTVTLKITYIDKEKQKMTLSKKHLEYNPWQDVHLKQHDIVTGSVERFTNTGAIIKVGNIEGFLGNREASDTGKPASDILKVGDIISAEVVRVDPRTWHLALSVKTIEEKKNREYVDKYIDENVSSSSSLKDLFEDKEKGHK